MKKMLVIISATDEEGKELDFDQVRKDWEKLKVANAAALEDDPTWSVFGGTLTINGNKYQVG